jgi:Cupin superfamily protein
MSHDAAVAAPSTLLDIDGDAFSASFGRDPTAVRHNLVGHPLLTLDAIAELADSMPLKSIERHSADLALVMPGGAPDLEGPPSETVRGIETNGCWMVLWYIEQHPDYADLLDTCLDEAAAHLGAREGGMCQREGFLFLSAPGAVTPVHFDPEHNFLLQIKGVKDMHVCKFPDRESALHELDRYHDGGHRNLEAVPSEGTLFRMDPGDGVYVPSFMPHWVKNGDEASISLSITFRTRTSRREERVHRINARLRKLKLSPAPAGASESRDRAKEALYMATRGWGSRLRSVKRLYTGRRRPQTG